MGAKSDQVKGHAKEAAGIVIGDKDLQSSGKADRRAGEAEENIDLAREKLEALMDHARQTLDELIDKAKEELEDVATKAKDALHRK